MVFQWTTLMSLLQTHGLLHVFVCSYISVQDDELFDSKLED